MTEYGPVADDHGDRYRAILRQAFSPEQGPPGAEAGFARDWPPTLGEPRGVFDGGDLVSVCKLYELEATVRGTWTTIGGLGAVATPPEHRRSGHARRLLRGALTDYREAGIDLVALWPFSVPFYRGCGWGVATLAERVAVTPDQLRGVSAPSAGRFVELSADDWRRLRDVEAARVPRPSLSLRRSEAWWRERTLAAWPGDPDPYCYGYEVDGDLRGFAVLAAEDRDEGAGGGRRLDVDLLAAVDPIAERALLRFLGDFDSQVGSVRIEGPVAATLGEYVPDPEAADWERYEAPMVRLTDVERALETIAWPAEDASGSVVLDVADPLLDRNDRRFAVTLAEGDASVEPADEDATVDVGLDVATLSRLVVGALSPEEAERVGQLEVGSDTVRDRFQSAVHAEPVALQEFF